MWVVVLFVLCWAPLLVFNVLGRYLSQTQKLVFHYFQIILSIRPNVFPKKPNAPRKIQKFICQFQIQHSQENYTQLTLCIRVQYFRLKKITEEHKIFCLTLFGKFRINSIRQFNSQYILQHSSQ